MMRATVIAAALALTPCPSVAGYFDNNGNTFFDRCYGKENIICSATAGAYMDMMIALGTKCANEAGVNRDQAKAVLIKYMVDHPEHRNAPLPFSAILAFEKAFGCKLPKGLGG